MQAKEYSLRERKHARTKIAIVNAFVDALEKNQFEDISIRRICKEVDISEGTFFNYFSEKLDLINYYTHLLFLKIIWEARQVAQEDEFPGFIEALFTKLADEHKNANIIYKMISVLLLQREKPKELIVPEIERKMLFPDYPGIEDVPLAFPDEFFRAYLEKAYKKGLLPAEVKVNDLKVSLDTIMIGTLLALKFDGLDNKKYHYLRQLRLLWQGLGIKNTTRRK